MLPIVTVGDALAGPTVGEVLFDNRAGVGTGARAPARARPPADRRAHPEPPLDAGPAGRARRRREVRGARAGRDRGQHAPLDGGGDRGGRGAAGARPAPDGGVLPLGLDRLRRLRGGGRAAGSRSRATCRWRATTTTRSRGCVAPPLTSVDWGLPDVATAAAGLLAAAVDGRPRPRSRGPRPRRAGAGRARLDRRARVAISFAASVGPSIQSPMTLDSTLAIEATGLVKAFGDDPGGRRRRPRRAQRLRLRRARAQRRRQDDDDPDARDAAAPRRRLGARARPRHRRARPTRCAAPSASPASSPRSTRT